MSEFIEPIYTRFLLAMILGLSSRDILVWMNAGELKAVTEGKYLYFRETDVVDFLFNHPEGYGRIYCNDLIPLINHYRARIVEKLEERNGY